MSDKIYIVWNQAKTEGFATVDQQLACEAREGGDTNCLDADGRRSDLAVKFCELTGDEDCTIQVVETGLHTIFPTEELELVLYALDVYSEKVSESEKAENPALHQSVMALKRMVEEVTLNSSLISPLSAVRTSQVSAIVSQCGGDLWGEHPDHPKADWKYEVENGDTFLGYWEWVWTKIDEEKEDGQ